jgi:hypothetical protein
MRIRRSLRVALTGIFCLAAASPAAAQYTSSAAAIRGMDERFRLNLGGFFQNFSTTLRLDSAALGTGTEISLEDDLGQSANKTSFRADGYWRFGRHGSLQFSFLTWNRSGSLTLSRDIQFGDHVYHAGAAASSTLRVTDAELYYGYSFVNTGEAELGFLLGVSTFFNSASLEASGFITGPGGTTCGCTVLEDRSLVAPIPAIGGFFRYTLLPGFFVYGRAKVLPQVTVSGYSGSMFDGRAGFDVFFGRNVGIGGAYSYTKIKFARVGADTLEVDYRYSGPLVYLSFAF